MAELTLEEATDAYRERLAVITDPGQLTAECLGSVFYGGHAAPMENDQAVGTILGVKHAFGVGLFGPTIWTWIKLCPACVHREGKDDCIPPSEAEWRLVMWIDAIRRNGDGAPEPDDSGVAT